MKKTLFFAAIAAMFVMASCQKDSDNEENQESKSLVFSATIDNSITRTTINTDASSADKGKVSWETTDEITISDGKNSATYKVQSIDASGKATFEYKSGATLATSGVTYKATYGSAPATTQTYSEKAGKLPMSATSTTTNLTFTTTCGLLKLNLTALSTETDKTISKIEVIGTPTEGSETTYTLTCSSEQNIGSAKDFYIALPAGTYTDMVFYNKTGFVCQKTSTGMTIVANDIQPVKMSSVAFNLLPGKFTVASGKQVRFSKGNLYWDGSAYHLESAQYDSPNNTTSGGTYSTSHVAHFYYSKTETVSRDQTYSDVGRTSSDIFWCNENNKLTVDGTSNLYVLTKAEWSYLIGTTAPRSESLRNYNVTVAGKPCCLVIAPDGFSGTIANSYSAEEWATAEAAYGLVCLPAAAYRDGSSFANGGRLGFYWSATPYADYAHLAYYLYFSSSNVNPASNNARNYGFSVRLVK